MRTPITILTILAIFYPISISAFLFNNKNGETEKKPETKILKKNRPGNKFKYQKRNENLRTASTDLSLDNEKVKTYFDGDLLADGLLQYTGQKDYLQAGIQPYLVNVTAAEVDSPAKLDDLVSELQDQINGTESFDQAVLDFFDLHDNDNNNDNPKTYAFLVNGEDGNVIYHPNMAALNADQDCSDKINYKNLEPFTNSIDIIENILANPSNMSVFEVPELKRYKLVQKENGLVYNEQASFYSDVPSDFDERHQGRFSVKCRRVDFVGSGASDIMCVVIETTRWSGLMTDVIDVRVDLSGDRGSLSINGQFYHDIIYSTYRGITLFRYLKNWITYKNRL